MVEFDAIILAGGTGSRLGGRDKALLRLGGTTLLDRVLRATSRAHRTIVVGPERAAGRTVTWCREDPPGAGPAAALAEGLRHVDSDVVVVVAVDYALVTAELIASLLEALGEADGVVPIDLDGHQQPLLAGYRAEALRAALGSLPTTRDAPVLRALRSLDLKHVRWGRELTDVDNFEQLQALGITIDSNHRS